jgi:hypothetical protein
LDHSDVEVGGDIAQRISIAILPRPAFAPGEERWRAALPLVLEPVGHCALDLTRDRDHPTSSLSRRIEDLVDLSPRQGSGLAQRDGALHVRRGELASELADLGLDGGRLTVVVEAMRPSFLALSAPLVPVSRRFVVVEDFMTTVCLAP